MRKLAAVLIFVAVIVGAWFLFQSRVIKVWLYTDYAFRFNHPDWPTLVEARFREVNRVYLRNRLGIRWVLVNSNETDPSSDVPGIDNRRGNLLFRVGIEAEREADVFVVLTGVRYEGRTGSVSPFARTAVVEDFPDKPESLNGRLLAHELAHLFGVPHDPAWLNSLMANKPESYKFSPQAVDLIRRMHNYPFSMGVDGLARGSWEKRAVAAIAENDTGAHRNASAYAHAVLGTALLQERKREPALVEFRQAVQADPRNAPLRLDMAEAYVRDGLDDQALQEAREVVRLAPDNALSHRALGGLLGRAHLAEEAVQELQTAIRLEPQNTDTRVMLGVQLSTMPGRIDDAIEALQAAIRINPEAPLAREALTRVQNLKQRVAEELVRQRQRIARDPSDSDAHYRLAKAEARSGDLAGAIRDFQRSAELRPGSGTPHAELAELYYLRGDFAGAWAEVRKARALGTEPPPTLVARLPAQK